MTPQQIDTASQAVADIVRDACSGSSIPAAETLKVLAESAADAMTAAFKKINEAI